jgi:hypothetical protein
VSQNAETDAILARMAQIRCDLHDDMQGMVENARTMSDWRYYARSYPWAWLGAATVLGYLVVPARTQIVSPDARELAKLAKRNQLVVQQKPEPHKRGGLTGTLFTLASNLIIRGVISYIGQKAGKTAGHTAAEAEERPLPNVPR